MHQKAVDEHWQSGLARYLLLRQAKSYVCISTQAQRLKWFAYQQCALTIRALIKPGRMLFETSFFAYLRHKRSLDRKSKAAGLSVRLRLSY